MDDLFVGHIHVRYSTPERSALNGSNYTSGTASPNIALKTTTRKMTSNATNYTSRVQQHVTNILTSREGVLGVNLTKNATKEKLDKSKMQSKEARGVCEGSQGS